MTKVNADYDGIDSRNRVRNSVPEVDSIVMFIVKVLSERINPKSGFFHSVSGAELFIMHIYVAHFCRVTVCLNRPPGGFSSTARRTLTIINGGVDATP